MNVRVSSAESASISFWPETDIVVNAEVTEIPLMSE